MKNAAAQAEPITNPSAAFWEGAFVGEPQVPTTFERSDSAAEVPPAGVRRSRSVTAGHGAFVGEPLLRRAAPWRPQTVPAKWQSPVFLLYLENPRLQAPGFG